MTVTTCFSSATGAVGAIVKNTFKTDFPAIYVEDTHEAMQTGAYYRNRFDIPVIGVTVGWENYHEILFIMPSQRNIR